jgi:thiol-disulfide isomerase/thioredoxin
LPDDRGDIRWGRTGAYDPRSLAPWLALLLLVALAALGSALAPKARADAPDFLLASTGVEGGEWTGPQTFTLSQHRGRVVVLDLMAVRCTPCRAVTDEVLLPLWREVGARSDVAFLSVDVWADPRVDAFVPGIETEASLRRLQNETGVPWRHALDSDLVWQSYGAEEGLPKVVVVDRWGRVAAAWSGEVRLDEVRDAVRAELP